MPERVTVSVRQLVEFLLRGGDIDSGAAGGRDRMAQGSALHRRLQQEGGKHYRPEVFLTLTREVGGVTVTVEGRADGILEEEDGSVTVDEIKTTTSPLDGFAEEAQQDDPALLASLVGAGILAAGQERYSLTVLAIRLEQDGKNRTTPDMAYTVDMLLGKLCRSRSVYSGGRLLTLLIAEEELRGLELAIDELRQSFARVLELRAIVGISHPFTSFCRCHAASREAVDAQRFAGESGIYHISQIAAESGTAQTDLGALLAPLDNLLRSGSREELEKQLVQSFGASSGTAESDSVTLQVLALAQRVLHTAVSPGEAAALLRRCRIPEPLFSISPPQELQRRVTALCLAARDLLAERRRDGVSLLCAQAMETIEKQYMEEDLSLSGVSEQLHVSPNYLSANMKKYAGDTFMNLLIKKRMEVAHALLTTSSLKIYEVARQCGYSDQHYFSFCFKKYYGVSPAQLRRAESERGGDGA